MFVDTQKEHLDKLHYPLRVVELWCRNTRAYNIARDVFLSDLISHPACASSGGGFFWEATPQGDMAWDYALMRHEYDYLYRLCPHLNDETYIDFERFD